MSDNKKYYYLKLKDTFFDSEEMKILESQKNGILYQNIYLKLCLLSVKNNGALTFKAVMPYDVAMLSTILRIDIGSVKTAIDIFIKLGLVVISDNETMYMADIQSLIGQSSTEADRIKEYRNKLKCTNEVQMLQDCTPEIETEKKSDIESKKDTYKEFIPPTQEEVIQYIKQRNSCVNPYYFYEYYKNTNWTYTDDKGKIQKVKNWKNKLLTWESHQNDKTPYFKENIPSQDKDIEEQMNNITQELYNGQDYV